MRDEHYYTRALKLNPKNAGEYYIGRAEFYCTEHDYNKAYKDFIKAEKLGANIKESYKYKTYKDFINADKYITELTDKILTDPDNYENYCLRAKYYLLQKKYSECMFDVEKAIQINPCPYTYDFKDDICRKIREYNVFDSVKNSKKKDLINAYKLRIKLAKENIILYQYADYWKYRALKDLDNIIGIAKDKTLAMYLKVNFFEDIQDTANAIMYCKKVIEESKSRTDKLGKTLTYLYEVKLISLYSNKGNIQEGIKLALLHPDKPTSVELKKGLKYINDFATIIVDVLRANLRKDVNNL